MIFLGAATVASEKALRAHLMKGKDIAKRNIEQLGNLLAKDDLQASMSWGEYVTESTISPFSDKLILFHTMMLAAVSTGNYGMGITGSPRKNVAATYALLMAEAGDYGKDTTDILIEKAWFEQPP